MGQMSATADYCGAARGRSFRNQRRWPLAPGTLIPIGLAMLCACSGGREAGNGASTNLNAFEQARTNPASGAEKMSSKMRPWNRPDVKVFRPEPVRGIEYDPKERKAVDPATGEFIIMRPAPRDSPGQFLFGTQREGWIVSGGYTGGWYPEERASVTFINALRLRSNLEKYQSRSEYDAAPIARMMRGFLDAEQAADPHFAEIRKRSPPVQTVVIDTRLEQPRD